MCPIFTSSVSYPRLLTRKASPVVTQHVPFSAAPTSERAWPIFVPPDGVTTDLAGSPFVRICRSRRSAADRLSPPRFTGQECESWQTRVTVQRAASSPKPAGAASTCAGPLTADTWAEILLSFERINTSRLHELHESKLPFVSRITFIRSKLSIFSAHVSDISYHCRVTLAPAALRLAASAPLHASFAHSSSTQWRYLGTYHAASCVKGCERCHSRSVHFFFFCKPQTSWRNDTFGTLNAAVNIFLRQFSDHSFLRIWAHLGFSYSSNIPVFQKRKNNI